MKELPPYKQQTSKVMHLTMFILSYGAQCPGFVLRKKYKVTDLKFKVLE